MIKASELRVKDKEELTEILLSLRRDQFHLNMQRSTGQLKQVHSYKQLRTDIARVKTVLHDKKIGEVVE